MSAIFLSASVPRPGRGRSHEPSDPLLIQRAVRELFIAMIERKRMVWGGHPTITPMIWAICKDVGLRYAKSVVLYQSRFFQEHFPEENTHFENVVYVDAVAGDREASLLRMRKTMLAREDLTAAAFIGGMEGVEAEYTLFKRFHPHVTRFDGRLPNRD
jgi:hypothetical protein